MSARAGLLLVLACVAGAAVLAHQTGIVPAVLGQWTFTRSVEQDTGTYYRLKVDLIYRGEPQHFDIVVGCRVKTTRYKDNDRTVEVGVAPFAYGLRMADGRGVVVRPPEACNGETTENGRVPASLLPLVVTYENADAPWFGLAYASDDAYDSPLSELKFLGATISKASRMEWEEWRRVAAPKNFVTYALLGMDVGKPGEQVRWKPGDRFMGSECLGFAQVRMADAARAIVHAQWPADRPTYWYPNEEAGKAIWPRPADQASRPEWLVEGYRAKQYFPTYANFFPGLPRRQPGAMIFYVDHVAGAVYPARTDLTPNRLGPDGRLEPEIDSKEFLSWAEADVRPELRGFAYCDNARNIDGLPSFINVRLTDDRRVNRINSHAIEEYPPRPTGRSGRTNFMFAVERDEYVYFYRTYGLVNIFGGL